MYGNVWEYCEDIWHENYAHKPNELLINGNRPWLSNNDEENSSYPLYVARGGDCDSIPSDCRSATRVKAGDHLLAGLRLAISLF